MPFFKKTAHNRCSVALCAVLVPILTFSLGANLVTLGYERENKKLASNAKRYPLCENRRIPFTRNPPVSCLLGRCPNPRRTQNWCSGTMDKSIGCAISQIACGRAAQRCSASFSRRSFASSCSLSSSRIRSILALAVSSSFISSRAFR